MPLYRYQCDNCGYTFTSLEPVNTDHLKPCGRCGRLSARRGLTRVVGIVYKGSGFHATDYRRNGDGARGRAREQEKEPERDKEREGAHHRG